MKRLPLEPISIGSPATRSATSSDRLSATAARSATGSNAGRGCSLSVNPATTVVARARRSFRVILVGADRQRLVREALDRSVVEVPRRDYEARARGDRRFVDLELVVLAGDDDAAGTHVLHRMVAPVVTEGQARG